MELLQQIQELAQKSKYEPYLNHEYISSVELLTPSRYEEVDEENPELLYYFLLNGYSTHISTEIPFGIKVIMNNGKEYFVSGKRSVIIANDLGLIGRTMKQKLLDLLP